MTTLSDDDTFNPENSIRETEINLFKKYNLFYVHIPKTGGNTVLRTLRGETREHADRDISNEKLISLFGANKSKNNKPFTSHLRMTKKLKDSLSDDIMVFSTVRNPFDRAYSLYMWSRYSIKKNILGLSQNDIEAIREKTDTFEQFLNNCQNREFPLFRLCKPQTDWLYSKNGEKLFDIVCKLENLKEDMKIVYKHANLKMKSSMFKYKINTNPLKKGKHYKDEYNQETINMAREIYKKDLENFNYDF